MTNANLLFRCFTATKTLVEDNYEAEVIGEIHNNAYDMIVFADPYNAVHFCEVIPPKDDGGFKDEIALTQAHRTALENTIFSYISDNIDVIDWPGKSICFDVAYYNLLSKNSAGVKYHSNAWSMPNAM